MRFHIVLGAALLIAFVTGCGAQKHPSFSALQKVPGSQLSALKKYLKQAPIKHLELPTKLPFTVTKVYLQSSVSDMKQTHMVDLLLTGGKHDLDIEVLPDPSNQPPNTKTDVMQHVKVTKLSDGTKALYGNNGNASMLDWATNGANYSIASITNTQNKPDLTEKQLIHVADSFQ